MVHWIVAQQYTDFNSTSYGAIKMSPEPVAYGVDRKPYCRVCAYFANLAVTALLRTDTPDGKHVADLWIRWYLGHLNPQAAPDGVPCDHFYRPDGNGETICVKAGDPLLCRHDDATDSAAATFFSLLWAAHKAGLSEKTLATGERKQQVEALATVLLKLQQPDGLCWAKTGYHVKYLEDNSEVFAGLRDLADLELEVFHDAQQAAIYRDAAERVRRAITSELHDPQTKLFLIAKFENGKSPPANLDQWYPDTQAQLWPSLFGVVAPNDPINLAVVSAVNKHWNGQAKPDWAEHPERVNQGTLEAGDAYGTLLAGQTAKTRVFLQSTRRFKFRGDGFVQPFNVGDAGWMLQILIRSSAASN